MPKFNLLSVMDNQESADHLLFSVKDKLYNKEVNLKNCYFNLQGQLLAEGWIDGSRTLIEVGLASELKPEWYVEALDSAIEKIKKTEVSEKNYPGANTHMLSFLEAYFLNYVEKGLAEIDGEKKGSLLQKLNAKLSFLSSLESTFRARFGGDLIK
ncbi:hypothetical protein ACR9PT_14365, partial [Piscirickettsia salmonis]|uniref:hypothetical protein n=1 Tax=Piscirickettsia salmonis TaxID=1238 RepID=UPI003EB8515D